MSLKGANSKAKLYNTFPIQPGTRVQFTPPNHHLVAQVSTDGASLHKAMSQKKNILLDFF